MSSSFFSFLGGITIVLVITKVSFILLGVFIFCSMTGKFTFSSLGSNTDCMLAINSPKPAVITKPIPVTIWFLISEKNPLFLLIVLLF